ncbi:MAG: tRNA lysidine(34) synthetase TilS [Gaiellales bacterium]
MRADAAARIAARADALGLVAGAPVVAMLSGGADSTLLAVALAERGCAARLVHVAHGLRGAESEADADACRALAEGLGLPLQIADGAVAPGGNLEARLREVRRAAALDAAGADPIATGHTLSDRAETVLYRLAASGTPRGLAALPARDGQWVRPLIDCSRDEVRRELAARGIAWRDDPTNREPGPARNRIRLDVLPSLALAHPGAERNLARAAAIADDERALLDALADDLIRNDGAVPIDALADAPVALQRIALRRAAARVGVTLGHDDVEALRTSPRRRTLPGDAVADVRDGAIRFLPPGSNRREGIA